MNILLRHIILLCFLVAHLFSFGQGENNNWYFGGNAGLNFATSPPTALTNGALSTAEGCASVSDAAGNLLFYTDGTTIYDANHAIMANGSFLSGNWSTTQSAIIVKQPGNTNLYYVFTLGANGNGPLDYSIVDMTLASGSGSVITKNVSVHSNCTEQLTCTKHCNGVDTWIVYHEAYNQNYRANLLTAAGLGTTAVTSAIGYSLATGQMKISPNGKKLASANQQGLGCELFDFDPSTGAITNSLSLSPSTQVYGCEFSPDGTKFYASRPNLTIYQWDLCAGSPTAIAASAYSVSTNFYNYSLQLGPDGKIYVANNGNSSLDAITTPNQLGSAMGYSAAYVSLSTKFSLYGLPAFVSGQKPPPIPFTHTVNNSYGCQTAAFTLPPTVNTSTTVGCSASGYSLVGQKWIFGDPASGTANISTLANPIHAYTALGTYTAMLILNYSCGGGTDTIRQSVIVNQPCITINNASITCASLGSATVITASGAGPYSYTWMPTAQTSSVATGLSPGTYTLTVFDFVTNLTYTAYTTFTSLIPLTGNLSTSSGMSCNGASTGTGVVTNLSGGSGNQTYLWTNGSVSFSTTSTNSLSAGLWSVNVTDALTGCQINQSFFINQPPAQNLNLSSNTPSACVGTNAILSGTNSGGTPFGTAPFYSYRWTAGQTSDTQTVSESNGGNHIYTLTSTDANNCLVSNTIAVNFIVNPVLNVVNASICPNDIGVMSVSGAASYTWFTSTSLGVTGNTFTDNPLSTKQYTVIGSALGCSSSALASIVLKQAPGVLITSNSPKCDGDNLSLTGFGASAFLWSGPNNFTSAVQVPTLTNISLGSAGVYSVLVTAANSCTNSATHTVVVNPSPTLSVVGSTVCTSQTLNLYASSSATNFTWSGPQNFNSTLQNPFINSPVVSNSGTYTLKVTSAQGCTNSAFAIANVIPPPSLTSSLSSNGTLCAQALNGSPNTITLTSGGAATYTLFTPNHISNQNAAGPSYSMASLPPFISGPATATLMGSNGVCSVSMAINFSVIPNPTLTPLTATPVICAGETFTYTSSGANSYTWGQNSPNLTTYTGPATVASPTQTSVYSVVGGSLGCYSGTQTSTITVRPLPQFSLNPIKPEICLNEKIDLVAFGNAESYTWSPYTGLSSMNGFSVNAGPLSQQTYTALGVLNTCTSTAMITVSVLPLPNAVASVLNDKLCVNSLVSLNGLGGSIYNWEGPLDLKLGGQTATFVASSVNYSGTYLLTVTDTNGCKNKTTVDLTIYNSPGGDLFASKKEACVPFISEFRSSVSSLNVLSSWTLENKNYTSKNFSHAFVSPGIYIITGNFKDTLTSCVSSNSFVIKANPNPVADFSILPEKPIENLDEVIFTNTSSGEQQTKWNWYFTNNQGYHSDNKNTSYLFTDAGIYPIAMVVTNTWGCKDTIVKTIKIEADLAVYVPNVFTPNGDDLNDVFIPVTRALKQYELSIFDRWGTKVFSTTNAEIGWDGTFRGQECKMDVYVWKINLSSVNGEMKTLTGHVTLSR